MSNEEKLAAEVERLRAIIDAVRTLDFERLAFDAVDAWVDSPPRSDTRETMRTVVARHLRQAISGIVEGGKP